MPNAHLDVFYGHSAEEQLPRVPRGGFACRGAVVSGRREEVQARCWRAGQVIRQGTQRRHRRLGASRDAAESRDQR